MPSFITEVDLQSQNKIVASQYSVVGHTWFPTLLSLGEFPLADPKLLFSKFVCYLYTRIFPERLNVTTEMSTYRGLIKETSPLEKGCGSMPIGLD